MSNSVKSLLPNGRGLALLLGLFVIVAFALAGTSCRPSGQQSPNQQTSPTGSPQSLMKVRYGISAYQDTILPVVAQQQGWYREEGLDAELKVLPWGEVMSSLAGGGVDVAIQNFNSFQENYPNISGRGVDVVFYYPLFIFKGAAIMVRGDGPIKPLSEILKQNPGDRAAAVRATAAQLRGRTVVTTEGTEMEQVVLAAIEKAGLRKSVDVKIVHAESDDGLHAFLGGEGDAYSGGVTERTGAQRRGAVVMLEAADLNPPVIDGLVTTRQYAEAHPEVLNKLVGLWFRTIKYMQEDLDRRAVPVIDYLASVGSTKYTVQEYKQTWTETEVYPDSPQAMGKVVFDPSSQFFWRSVWGANNDFLIKTKKLNSPVPYEAFLGETVQKQLPP